MEIKKILDNKIALMGCATLLVLFAHFDFHLPYLLYIQRMCSCCIDIFLLVSGIGCYFSIQKHSIKEFFKRRILRLFPFYLITLFLYGIYAYFYGEQPISFFIEHNDAFISLFLYGEISGGFIVAITLFYTLTPIVNKLIQKQGYYGIWFMIAIGVISAQLEFYTTGSFYMINNFIISRFPSYIGGLLLGYLLQNKPNAKISMKYVYIGEICCMILMLGNLLFNNINNGFIMKIIDSPYGFFSALLLSKLFDTIPSGFFQFFGKISLQAYLLFEKILHIIEGTFGPIYNQFVTDGIAVVITTFIAIIYNSIISKIKR